MSELSNIPIDGFRFINNLNTTARQLSICSKIITCLGSKQIPRVLLSQMLIRWSQDQEKTNRVYRDSKGKLTDNEKETSALKHYLDLTECLHLTSKLNEFYANTRLAHILLYLVNQKQPSLNQSLSNGEKFFYLFQLFNTDADGIIYVMQQLANKNYSQKELQKNFKEGFSERLILKGEHSHDSIKNKVSEKYRSIHFVWKNVEKYSEHLLVPRCEWLAALNIVDIQKVGSYTTYALSDFGHQLYNQIPLVKGTNLKDVSEVWIYNDFFCVYSQAFSNGPIHLFEVLGNEEKNTIISEYLEKSLANIKTSNSFRIPLFDSLLFICLQVFVEKNIVITFSNIITELNKTPIFKGKQFLIKEASRINEGYITTRLA